MKIVGDRIRKRRPEHRDRRGEDEARTITVAGGADRFNERARAVEIDVDAFLEMELRLAGHHCGEREDQVGPPGDRGARRRGIGDIGGAGRDAAGKALRLLRSTDVDQRELVDRLAVERAGGNEARHELAPDHSGGAGDENVHGLPAASLPYSAIPPSTRWVWPVM